MGLQDDAASTPDPLRPDAPVPEAEADATPSAEAATRLSTTLEPDEPGPEPTRRPCFHCGAMTPVHVLEKTGELCWRCYRPVGQAILKSLLWLAVVLVTVAGVLIAWRAATQEETSSTKPLELADKEFTPEQKLTILKRHLLDRVPVTVLCREYEIPADEFQRWQQQFFEVAEAAFERTQVREPNLLERRISSLEQKLQLLGKVLGELRDGMNQLRKESGRYEGSTSQQYILDSSGPPPRP